MNRPTNIKTELVRSSIRNHLLLIVIFLVGLALRIYDLGSESIWYDEAISIAVAKLGLIDQISWSYLQNDNNPLLYYELLHFWVWIFGDSELVVRVPSALFGSFSILAIYMVGRLTFNKKVGLIAALILATSVFHIKYSQEARAYSLLAFLTLLSFYYYLKIISSDRRLYVFGYLLSSVLMLYTHYYGFLILAVQNIFFFGNYLKTRDLGALSLRKWLTYQIILGVLYLPGFVLFAKHAVAIQGGFWLPEPTLSSITRIFVVYSGSLLLCLVLVIFSLLSFLSFRRLKNSSDADNLILSKSNRFYLVLLWLFVPILLPFLLSLFSTPILLYRYLIAASLAFYLLAAIGMVLNGKRTLIFISVFLIIVLSSLNLEKYYGSVDKYQWRETISFVEDNASSGDYIAVFPRFEIESANYYKKRDNVHYLAMSDELIIVSDIGNKNLWFILADHAFTRRKAFEKVMNERYKLVDQKKYKSLNLYKYRKNNSK